MTRIHLYLSCEDTMCNNLRQQYVLSNIETPAVVSHKGSSYDWWKRQWEDNREIGDSPIWRTRNEKRQEIRNRKLKKENKEQVVEKITEKRKEQPRCRNKKRNKMTWGFQTEPDSVFLLFIDRLKNKKIISKRFLFLGPSMSCWLSS